MKRIIDMMLSFFRKNKNDNMFKCNICGEYKEKPNINYNVDVSLFMRIMNLQENNNNICIDCFNTYCKNNNISFIQMIPENYVYRIKLNNYKIHLRIYSNSNFILDTVFKDIKNKKPKSIPDLLQFLDDKHIIYDIITNVIVKYDYNIFI